MYVNGLYITPGRLTGYVEFVLSFYLFFFFFFSSFYVDCLETDSLMSFGYILGPLSMTHAFYLPSETSGKFYYLCRANEKKRKKKKKRRNSKVLVYIIYVCMYGFIYICMAHGIQKRCVRTVCTTRHHRQEITQRPYCVLLRSFGDSLDWTVSDPYIFIYLHLCTCRKKKNVY